MGQKQLLFGDDLEDLVEIITKQIQFDNNLGIEQAYDEIVNQLEKMEGSENFKIITTTVILLPKNPIDIQRTDNFQFFIESPYLIVANKFFK